MVEVPDPRRSEADKVQLIQVGTKRFRKVLPSFCPGGMVSIVMISETLLLRATATDGRILRECRAGKTPSRAVPLSLPTAREALVAYCEAKNLKPVSCKRYDSLMRTHFGDWLDRDRRGLHCCRHAQREQGHDPNARGDVRVGARPNQ